jgi:hypothetical protein
MPSIPTPHMPRGYMWPQLIPLSDFSGGVNTLEDAGRVGGNQTFNSLNFTTTANGSLIRRGGAVSLSTTIPASSIYIFDSMIVSKWFVQSGTGLYSASTLGGVWTLRQTFSTAAKVAMVDFAGKVVVVHPIDGVYDSSDGVTFTNRSATVKGSGIASWQNKLWVADSSSTRVWWSNAGTSGTWTTASDFVDLREHDDNTLTAIGGGQGMDIAGRPGLLVFKADSHYRINNSSTGAYTTIDTTRGAQAAESITAYGGISYVITNTGVYETDGVNTPSWISGPIASMFSTGITGASPVDYVATVSTRDLRLYFAVASRAYAFEYHLPTKSWWIHQFNGGGSTGSFKSAFPGVLLDNVGSTVLFCPDESVATDYTASGVPCEYWTPWAALGPVGRKMVQRAVLTGRGTYDVSVAVDYDHGTLKSLGSVALSAGGSTSTERLATGRLYGLGPCRVMSMKLSVTAANSLALAPTLPAYFSSTGYRVPLETIEQVLFEYTRLGKD